MKKIVIFILILSFLFIGALFIYDFSDEIDEKLTTHEWFTLIDDNNYLLNLKKGSFEYKNINNEKSNYNNCHNYVYNSSSNVIKLDCNVKNNKLYIASFSEDELTVTIDGIERVFFSTIDKAILNNFLTVNNLTNEEYLELLNVQYDAKYFVSYKEFNSIYKGKEIKYIVLISKDINYDNIFEYNKLKEILNDDFVLIQREELSDSEFKEVSHKLNIKESNSLIIYEVANKKVKAIELTDFNNE